MNWKIFIAVVLLTLSCKNKSDKLGQDSAPPEYEIIESDQVTLSDFEKDDDGFVQLFTGESLKGWRGYGKDKLPPKWEIIEDCLVVGLNKNKEGGDIIFAHKFKNFELELEWKVSKAGNSGIFYLAREVKTKDPITDKYKVQPIYISAPECQVLDNENHPDAKLGKEGNRQSGSLYDMIAAKPQTAKPYGEWNKVRIRVSNGNVEHWLNEVKVIEYSFIGQQWIDLLQSGKFGENKWPLAFELMKDCGGKNHEGYIGLQDMGDEVWFKNVRVKVLE